MRAFRRTAVFAILPLLLVGARTASDTPQPEQAPPLLAGRAQGDLRASLEQYVGSGVSQFELDQAGLKEMLTSQGVPLVDVVRRLSVAPFPSAAALIRLAASRNTALFSGVSRSNRNIEYPARATGRTLRKNRSGSSPGRSP